MSEKICLERGIFSLVVPMGNITCLHRKPRLPGLRSRTASAEEGEPLGPHTPTEITRFRGSHGWKAMEEWQVSPEALASGLRSQKYASAE